MLDFLRAYLFRDEGVAGSNPATPTNPIKEIGKTTLLTCSPAQCFRNETIPYAPRPLLRPLALDHICCHYSTSHPCMAAWVMGRGMDIARLRLICETEIGKQWEEATEAERQRCREIARELDEAISAPWPTHLAGKTEH